MQADPSETKNLVNESKYKELAKYYAEDPMEVYQLILGGDLKFPSHFSRACMDLVTKLLTQNMSKRLGMLKGGAKDIIKHKWFSGFDWKGLLSLQMVPPIQPKIKEGFAKLMHGIHLNLLQDNRQAFAENVDGFRADIRSYTH